MEQVRNDHYSVLYNFTVHYIILFTLFLLYYTTYSHMHTHFITLTFFFFSSLYYSGKSTLLKLICRENAPTEGTVSVRSGLSIGRFHQHSAEILEFEKSPVDYISSKYQDRYPTHRLEEWRSVVGNYGIPKEYHLEPIKLLSDGLKTRLVFCEISLQNPHLLLFDEPTNAADMEMIDSMAEAIKAFNGGVVVISHDFRLLQQIAEEIWVVDKGLKVWNGDIRSYKDSLKKVHGYKK